jgi:hypothetical protein
LIYKYLQDVNNLMFLIHHRGKMAALPGVLPVIPVLLAVMLCGILLFPARAYATSIALDPSSGSTGMQIAITGDGFIGKMATIYWDEKKIAQNVPISKTGQISHKFEVPPASKGSHTVKVTDDSNWSNITASSNFSVSPSILAEPPWGKINTRIFMFGYGFAPKEGGIKLTWDGKQLSKSPIQADPMGAWSAQFDVPTAPKGEYIIGASARIRTRGNQDNHNRRRFQAGRRRANLHVGRANNRYQRGCPAQRHVQFCHHCAAIR